MTQQHDARGMRLLSHDDLGGFGTCGEGIALRESGGRRHLYIANERGPVNFTVLDVTDPTAPKVVEQTRLPHPDVRSNSLALAGDLMVVAYQTSSVGLQPAGIELFDVSDPASPRSITTMDFSGPASRGTHWVGFVDGRYAYLATGTPDSRPTNAKDDQFPVIVDLADPARPQEVGRWWLPGTQEGDDAPPPDRHPRFDAGFRAHNINVYPQRPDRAYVGYIDGGIVILDISDKRSPQQVSRLDYHPPLPGFTHTVLPLFSKDVLAVTDECVKDLGEDHPKLLWFADVSDEAHPLLISNAPMPSYETHAHRGGRFGAHNLHENPPFDWAWQREDIVFGSFFNAGVRAYDTTDPFQPREVASFVPAAAEGSKIGASQINDVYVTADGIVYAIDRAGGGLYILELDLPS